MGVLLAVLGMLLLLGVVLALFAGSLAVLRRSRTRGARLAGDEVVPDPAVLARWGWVPVSAGGVPLPAAVSGSGAACDLAVAPESGELAGSVLAVQVRFPAAAPFGWADGPVVWALDLAVEPTSSTAVLVVDRRRGGSGGLGPDRPTGDPAFDARYRVVRWGAPDTRRAGSPGSATASPGSATASPGSATASPGPAVRQRVVDLAADHLVVQGDRLTAAWGGPMDPARLGLAAEALADLRAAF